MTTKANHHNNAAMLIVSAARVSGLLQEIAQALRFVDQTHYSMPDGTVAREFCFACALRDELVEAFDEHTCLALGLLENFYGEGFVIHEASDEEVAPYLGISSFPYTPSQIEKGE